MLIKATVRYHLKPMRMAIINKSTNNKFWQRYREKVPQCTFGGNVATVESSMELPQKNKNETALRPSNFTSGDI